MQLRPRMAAAIAAVGLCLCLTGCNLDLKATIHSDDTFDVDATYWDEDNDVAVGCTSAPSDHLVQQELTDVGNPRRKGCHVTGTAIPTKEAAGFSGGLLVHTADRFTLGFPWRMTIAQPVETSTDGVFRTSIGRVQVAVTFPGEVIEHDSTAHVTGTTVTWAAPTEAMMAVALDRPGPRPELFWVGGGITAGVLIGAAGAVLIGRRRRAQAPDTGSATTLAAETDPAAAETDPASGVVSHPTGIDDTFNVDAARAAASTRPKAAASTPPPAAASPREDPSVWAPDSDR